TQRQPARFHRYARYRTCSIRFLTISARRLDSRGPDQADDIAATRRQETSPSISRCWIKTTRRLSGAGLDYYRNSCAMVWSNPSLARPGARLGQRELGGGGGIVGEAGLGVVAQGELGFVGADVEVADAGLGSDLDLDAAGFLAALPGWLLQRERGAVL